MGKEKGSALEARGDVEGEEEQDHRGGKDLEEAALVLKALGDKGRQGDSPEFLAEEAEPVV